MELILANALLVLPEGVVPGSVRVVDGRIAQIGAALTGVAAAHDLDGDFLIPGAVDLHTDNLERQVQPRSQARWPSRSAFVAHDQQCAAAGVTTVLDALCVGDLGFEEARNRTCTEGVADLDALAPTGLLRCEHFLHLRCELPAEGMLEQLDPLADHPRLRMVSLMDHCPGYGQYADVERYRAMRRRDGVAEALVHRRIAELAAQRARLRGPNRRGLLARLAEGGAVLASHDDRTEDEIAENVSDGIAVSEFPVSHTAAAAARRHGMRTISGAPNLVRGGSHNGNVSAGELLAADLVDSLASDYVPSSLIEAAFLAAVLPGFTLARAVALITDAPARMVGLYDRGRIAPGLRADLVRVGRVGALPVVREVWLGGARVA